MQPVCGPTDRWGPRNSLRQRAGCTPAVNRSFEHRTGGSTIWFGSTPILRENTLELVRCHPLVFPFHQPLRENLWHDGYLKCPHAAKTPYTYRHPCLRRDSNPGPTTQQSASLITITDSRKKKLSLQEALDLLQNLPSKSSDALTDDSSVEDVPVNYPLEFSLNS
ncbi:uncharacterized protein TNCV_3593291 [Trichonephila clavipes]|nr:uncharacterized protein TNCV_3593291 [Trichonephila clavipes]